MFSANHSINQVNEYYMIDDIYKYRLTTIKIPGFSRVKLINYPSTQIENGGLDDYRPTDKETNITYAEIINSCNRGSQIGNG